MLLKFNRCKMLLLVLFSLVVMVVGFSVLTYETNKIIDFMYIMVLLIHGVGFVFVKRKNYC